MTRDDITYRSIWGKEKKYSWEDVRSVRYKSAGRGAYRILIQTDRKISIETGMMENSEEAEKLIKGKGYLGLHYLGRIWDILAKNSCGGSGIQVQ